MNTRPAVSITSSCQRRDSHGGLEAARQAGFKHIELWSPPEAFNVPNIRSYAAEVKTAARGCDVQITSVVVPKDKLRKLNANIYKAIELANEIGADRVIVDYPKIHAKGLMVKRVRDASRVANDVRYLHTVMLSPFEFAEILKRAAEVADALGIKLLAEPPGGSDIGAKPLTFRGWRMIAESCHGIVLDLEHLAQQIIVQPIEEVYNTIERARRTGRLSEEDWTLVDSFYADYGNWICDETRFCFEHVIDNGILKMTEDMREFAEKLRWWAHPRYLTVKSDSAPHEIVLQPSRSVVLTLENAWSSLPIGEIHLAGGHLGAYLEKPVQTIFGPSDKALEHCYEICYEGVPLYIGSNKKYKLPDYLHIAMGGKLYGENGWEQLMIDVLHSRNCASAEPQPVPPLNFEIKPELVGQDLRAAQQIAML